MQLREVLHRPAGRHDAVDAPHHRRAAHGGTRPVEHRKRPRGVGELLRVEEVEAALHLDCQRVEELRRRVAERRKGPRRVGELLRLVVGQPALRLGSERVEELWREVARLGERPRQVGHLLRLEVGEQPLGLDRQRVEELRRRVAHRREGPRDVGDALRRQLPHPSLRLGRQPVEEPGRRVAPSGERPHQHGEGLRLKVAQPAAHLGRELRPEHVPLGSLQSRPRQPVPHAGKPAVVERRQHRLGLLAQRRQLALLLCPGGVGAGGCGQPAYLLPCVDEVVLVVVVHVVREDA